MSEQTEFQSLFGNVVSLDQWRTESGERGVIVIIDSPSGQECLDAHLTMADAAALGALLTRIAGRPKKGKECKRCGGSGYLPHYHGMRDAVAECPCSCNPLSDLSDQLVEAPPIEWLPGFALGLAGRGLHSSRPQIRVLCKWCGLTVHPGTTDPSLRMRQHREEGYHYLGEEPVACPPQEEQ